MEDSKSTTQLSGDATEHNGKLREVEQQTQAPDIGAEPEQQTSDDQPVGEDDNAGSSSAASSDSGCWHGPPGPPGPPKVDANVLYSSPIPGRTVVRDGDKVTKFNANGIRPSEVAAMRFVREHTTIPVPRVHDFTADSITMDFVEGTTAEKAWKTMSETERTAFCDQLGDYVKQLRAIKGSYIGGLDGGPAVDGRLFRHESDGPFADEAEYNRWLLADLKPSPRIVPQMIASQLRTDHEIVFTHGDLVDCNILVRDGRIVAIIDWEDAGFYPEYFELVRLLRGENWRCGYYNKLLEIFPRRYDAEYVTDSLVSLISRR